MDSHSNSRMLKKDDNSANKIEFYEMFKKRGFYGSLQYLTLDEIPRAQFFKMMKTDGNLNDYYTAERELIAHELIKFSIDAAGTEIKVALTEKGMHVRNKIEELMLIFK